MAESRLIDWISLHEPVKWTFELVAAPVATLDTAGAFLGNWRKMGIDGLEWDLPATAANAAEFGYPGAPGGGQAMFRKARAVTIGECASHTPVLAAIDPCVSKGSREQSPARELYPRLEEDWLLIADRNKALSYIRSCVLNGCRQLHPVRYRREKIMLDPPEDAEDLGILGEASRAVLAGIRQLPPRQREAVVLRYSLDMTEERPPRRWGSAGATSSPPHHGPASPPSLTCSRSPSEHRRPHQHRGPGPHRHQGPRRPGHRSPPAARTRHIPPSSPERVPRASLPPLAGGRFTPLPALVVPGGAVDSAGGIAF